MASALALGRQSLWVLDGANVFDPYLISQLATETGHPPEDLLKRIRISRSFTAHQMLSLLKRLVSVVLVESQSPCILLGPLTAFYDENIPLFEARAMFRSFCQELDRLGKQGIPVVLVCQQPPVSSQRLFVRQLATLADVVASCREVEWTGSLQPGLTVGTPRLSHVARAKKSGFSIRMEKPEVAGRTWLLPKESEAPVRWLR
jgi:hypothetical protein